MWQDKLHKSNREYGVKRGKKYIKKSYSNPFFGNKKKSNSFFPNADAAIFNLSSVKAKLILVFSVITFLVLLWYLFFSGHFMIKDIQASGEGRIPPQQVKNIAWKYLNKSSFLLPDKNLILLDIDGLKSDIEEKYAFNEIHIEKQYPSGLAIRFMEKEYAYVWIEREMYFYIDLQGYIIKEVTPEEVKNKNYPIIKNNSTNYIDNNQIAISKNYLDTASLLLAKLKDKKGIEVEKLIVDDEYNTIKADLFEGPLVYFNLESDLDKQIKKMVILKEERLYDDFKNKEYIDVRYGDSIYFK